MKHPKTKVLLIAILGLNIIQAQAETIKTIVEFFSFTCAHCASVNPKLTKYIAEHNVKYLDINTNTSLEALPTNIMYYIAVDAGVGSQFKDAYFKAISSGMAAYSPSTLTYVTKQVQNASMVRLMSSNEEKEHIKQKLNYSNQLLKTYHIQVTPTFLINQTTLLEGEDVINSLIGDNHV